MALDSGQVNRQRQSRDWQDRKRSRAGLARRRRRRRLERLLLRCGGDVDRLWRRPAVAAAGGVRGVGVVTKLLCGVQHFDSRFQDIGAFNANWSQDALKNEPMFFNANAAWARDNGGPITRAFVDALPGEWRNGVLDSRVHMLMQGWFPAIPGWHHDDVPRPPIPTGQHFATAGQPDYNAPRYRARHVMGLVNGGICPTAFAVGACTMPAVADGEIIYGVWTHEVDRLIAAGSLSRVLAPSGRVLAFDWQTFHTATATTGSGWRWFCRVSLDTERMASASNEIRQQAQVYLALPTAGW